ncbi:MAG: ABC transporter substrate-binding protein [Candidatus Syntrophoarchaeum sp.]|nr:ABC transporter substrate-binding protein [Candidatus Syntrophoarchaeum sp.]
MNLNKIGSLAMATLMALASVTLLSIVPVSASDDFTLGIYGNANQDDTIDMRDVTKIARMICWLEDEVDLADAKYDGNVNVLDIIQTELVILGREKELTVLDSAGRTVTIPRPIERIVVFNSETVETMRSLRATEKIVGVGKYTIKDGIFFPEFADYPNVGSVWSPDYEGVVSCNPDLVFLYGTCSVSYCDEIQNKLEELDPAITVVRLDCYKPESYVREVAELGYILNHVSDADNFIRFYDGYMETIRDRVKDIPENERPEVYFEAWRPYHTAGSGSGWHEKVVYAGGKNIFDDLSGYPDVDQEEVVERDPEIIIRAAKDEGGYDTSDVSELSEIWDEIMARPELANVTAVQNQTVYIIANPILGGVRHFIGIGYMAKWFYPDLFTDLDPETAHREYLTEFQGLDESLVDNGVFVYPPQES